MLDTDKSFRRPVRMHHSYSLIETLSWHRQYLGRLVAAPELKVEGDLRLGAPLEWERVLVSVPGSVEVPLAEQVSPVISLE